MTTPATAAYFDPAFMFDAFGIAAADGHKLLDAAGIQPTVTLPDGSPAYAPEDSHHIFAVVSATGPAKIPEGIAGGVAEAVAQVFPEDERPAPAPVAVVGVSRCDDGSVAG